MCLECAAAAEALQTNPTAERFDFADVASLWHVTLLLLVAVH